MKTLSFTEAELKQAVCGYCEARGEVLAKVDFDAVEVPEGFRDRIMKLAGEYFDKKECEKKQRRRQNLLRAASIFLAILVGVSLFFALNTEARAAVRNWVRKEYDKFVVYQFYGEPQEGVLPDYEPTWIPEGYVEIDKMVIGQNQGKSILYQNKDTDDMFIFDYMYYVDSPTTISASTEEGLFYEKSSIHGLPADFYYETDPTVFDMLYWIDDSTQLEFCVSSTLRKEDIFHIANSVKLKK